MSAELIHQMYIAYYQRPADPAGLIYWQDQLNANGEKPAGMLLPPPSRTQLSHLRYMGIKPLVKRFQQSIWQLLRQPRQMKLPTGKRLVSTAQIGFAIVNGAQNDDLRTVTKKVDYAEAFVALLTRLELA